MEKKLETVLELSRDPMLAVKDEKILFLNRAARAAFPGVRTGRYLTDLFPVQVLFGETGPSVAAAEIGGTSYTVACSDAGGTRFLSFVPRSGGEDHGLLSDGLLNNLLSTLFTVNLSVERIDALAGPAPAEGMAHTLSILRHNYFSLLRQIENLDTIYHIREDSLTFLPRQTDLVEFCASLAESLNALDLTDRAPIRFSSALPELPALVDGEKLARLLLNLLSNSLAHTPPEGEIIVRVSKSGENAVISVDDNGEGIPQDTLQGIFARYECPTDMAHLDRANNAGLGLSVASAIARLHGGALIIESREGQGTSARVTFPRSRGVEMRNGGDDPLPGGMTAILTELSGLLGNEYYTRKYLD